MKDQVIIIPVHGQLSYLKLCVESVYAKTNNPKVIIIDDASPDDETIDWIRDNQIEYNYAIIRHNMAKGFTASVNEGMEYALEHYDFKCLCLLNSDAEIITDHWFDYVEWYFMNGNDVGVASVMSDNALAQTVKNFGQYMSIIEKKPAVYSILLHGFCYFINRELIEKIGIFDADLFPHYGSEDDYSMESMKAGYKNLLVGKVFVHHANSKSYTEAQRQTIIRQSVPNLTKKWGRGMINRCGYVTIKAGEYINNFRTK